MFIVVSTVLILTTGLKLWTEQQKDLRVARAERAIVSLLEQGERTADQIRNEVLFDMADVTEALGAGIQSGAITHRIAELPLGDGSMVEVRIYSAR